MIIGIDASNIRAGGGLTHLAELLRNADPLRHGITKIIVWGGADTLGNLEPRFWLVKSHEAALDRRLAVRLLWKRFRLSTLARAAGCDLLFVPGGSYMGAFRPVVAMSQNMLPFDLRELSRFGWSGMTLKFLLLRWAQTRTFRRADGVIFLTQYASRAVQAIIGQLSAKTIVVPHGIDHRFFSRPRDQKSLVAYSNIQPIRLLYVSIIDMYKHQWNVAEAAAQLRAKGIPVVLDLIGPAYSPALRRLTAQLSRIDPKREFVNYLGARQHSELHVLYDSADICIFASSCENMPNILMEAMASGLPIACSDRGPMPEVLGDGGVYFDPEDPDAIALAISRLIESSDLRAEKAELAFRKARQYSWELTAESTMTFLAETAAGSQRHPENVVRSIGHPA